MLGDYILENCTAPGTGTTVSLAGAVAGRKTFAQAFTTGANTYYYLDDGTQAEWGYGTFTVGTPNTVSRTTVIGNTAGTTSKLNFSSTTRIYNSLPASKTPWLDINGSVTSIATSGADANGANMRMVSGSYGAILRNDGSSFYLMQTASGGQYGTWNSYRPLSWSLSTGAVSIDGTGSGTAFGGGISVAGTLGVTGATTLNGATAITNTTTISGTTTLSGATTTISNATTLNGAVSLNNTMAATNWITFNNAVGIRGKDTGGTVRNVISLDAVNNITIQTASASQYFRVLNFAATVTTLLLDNSGNMTVQGTLTSVGAMTAAGSTVVTANGGTYGISISGTAATASAVTWANVTSKPYTFDQSVAIGAAVSFGSVGGTFLTSSGNIAPGWNGGVGGFSCRFGANGSMGANTFNIYYSGGAAFLFIDNTSLGSIITSSDERLKHDIAPLADGALNRILSLRPVHFRWREGGIFRDLRREDGLIAQEVERVIPAAVTRPSDDPDATLALNPLTLIAHLIGAVQELAAEVASLKETHSHG